MIIEVMIIYILSYIYKERESERDCSLHSRFYELYASHIYRFLSNLNYRFDNNVEGEE